MHTIELTDDEVQLVRESLRSFRDDFTHEQQDLLQRIEAVLAKLPAAD